VKNVWFSTHISQEFKINLVPIWSFWRQLHTIRKIINTWSWIWNFNIIVALAY
jgi:hypothetical protein